MDLKEVIWNSADDKIPGPDRFNMEFYKVCWDIIKNDLFECVSDFFFVGSPTKGNNILFLGVDS